MTEFKKTALVLGAGGFIGSHMVKRLRAEGYWVRGVDLKYPEYGDTEAIFANPTHLYTNALISAALPSHPDIERDEIVLPGEVVSPVNPPVGDVFMTRTPLPVRKNHQYTKERPPLVEIGKDHYVVETPWSTVTGHDLSEFKLSVDQEMR